MKSKNDPRQKYSKARLLSLAALVGAAFIGFQNCGSFSPVAVSANLSSGNTAADSRNNGSSSSPSSALPTPNTSPTPSPTATPTLFTTTDTCIGPAQAGAPTQWVTPQQLRQFSGVSQIARCGEGQTVAVVISSPGPDLIGDLAKFSAAFGLPAPNESNFQVVAPDGGCGTGATPAEAHIDVEMVHAMAPKAKIIFSCWGTGASFAQQAAAIQAAISAGATIVSMSWGHPEEQANIAAIESVFANNPGVTFFAGSGDSGSNPDANGNPQVAYPAGSPHVVAVGATADDGSDTLSPWAKSGGGSSVFFPRPTWQQYLTSFSGNGRLVPDISFNGSSTTNTAIYGTQGWAGMAGTSVSSPIAAGMMALVNQIHGSPVGDIHAALYALGQNNQLPTYFRDVTNGNNGGYQALTGFDLVSGLGSPRATMLVPYLANYVPK